MDFKTNIKIILSIVITTILIVPIFLFSSVSSGQSELISNLLVVGITRLGVTLFFCVYVFRLFFLQEKHYITDAKHLFAWQFLLASVSKIMDLWLSYISGGDVSLLYTNPEFLIALKIRWILIVLTVAPAFFFFIRIYSKIWTMKLVRSGRIYNGQPSIEQSERIEKGIEIIVDVSFLVVSTIITIIAPSYMTLKMVSPLIIFPLMILGIITFRGLAKNKRLPQLNSQMIMIGYFIYIVSNVFRAILTAPIYMLFFEAIETVSFILAGLAFIIPPPYAKIVKKEVLAQNKSN